MVTEERDTLLSARLFCKGDKMQACFPIKKTWQCPGPFANKLPYLGVGNCTLFSYTYLFVLVPELPMTCSSTWKHVSEVILVGLWLSLTCFCHIYPHLSIYTFSKTLTSLLLRANMCHHPDTFPYNMHFKELCVVAQLFNWWVVYHILFSVVFMNGMWYNRNYLLAWRCSLLECIPRAAWGLCLCSSQQCS